MIENNYLQQIFKNILNSVIQDYGLRPGQQLTELEAAVVHFLRIANESLRYGYVSVEERDQLLEWGINAIVELTAEKSICSEVLYNVVKEIVSYCADMIEVTMSIYSARR